MQPRWVTSDRTIPSLDTSQRIPCVDSCQLATWCAISGCRLQHCPESVRFYIGFPVVRTGGRTDIRSSEYQDLSGIDDQIFLAMGLRLRSFRARVELRFYLPSDTRLILASFFLVACPIFSFPLSELHFRVAFLTSTEFWFVQQSSILRYRSTSFAKFSPNYFPLLLMNCNRGIWSLVSFTVPQSSFYYLLVACIVWYYASETFIGQEDMILKLWIYENHICII